MIWACQIAALIRALVTLGEQSHGKRSSLMRLAPADVIILRLHHLRGKDVYPLQEWLALADGVPVMIATEASRIEAFTEKLGRVVPRFLYLPLKPSAIRDALRGLESESRI